MYNLGLKFHELVFLIFLLLFKVELYEKCYL